MCAMPAAASSNVWRKRSSLSRSAASDVLSVAEASFFTLLAALTRLVFAFGMVPLFALILIREPRFSTCKNFLLPTVEAFRRRLERGKPCQGVERRRRDLGDAG